MKERTKLNRRSEASIGRTMIREEVMIDRNEKEGVMKHEWKVMPRRERERRSHAEKEGGREGEEEEG